jgi:undecaprenyl-diphosphatase
MSLSFAAERKRKRLRVNLWVREEVVDKVEVWNQAVFLALNARSGTTHWMLVTAEAIANDVIYFVPLVLVAMWLRGDRHRRAIALKACIVADLTLGAGQLICRLWPHPRPFMIGLGHTWMPHSADTSLPRDHMAVFSAVGLCLVLEGETPLGLALLAIGLCGAWARIYLGVHFPLDMLAAVGVVALTCALVTPVWRHLGGRATLLVEQAYGRAMAWPISRHWVCP